MSLERTFDVERINRVLRDPTVLPHVNLGEDVPDIDSFVENRDNVCLFNSHGGFLCFQFKPGWFDVHTIFLPGGRGKYAVDAACEGAMKLFTEYGAEALITFVPDGNWPARRLALTVGFKDDIKSEVFGVSGMTMKMEKPTCQ